MLFTVGIIHHTQTHSVGKTVVSRIRILAKSAYYLHHVCPHVSAWLPMDASSLNLILEISIKICRDSKFGHNRTWRLKYALMLPAILNRHKNALFE